MRVLAIDVGSSSVKATLFVDSRPRGIVRHPVPFHYDGLRAQTPAGPLISAVEAAARDAAGGRSVDVVAIDTFSPGVIVADSHGRVLAGCITHQDRRSVEQARAFGERNLIAATGNRPFPGGIGSTTLLWLRERLKLGACRVGQPSTLLLHHWTGEWLIDPSQAAFLGLLDIRTGQWFEPLVEFLGLDAGLLPRIVPADAVAGRLAAGAARRLGLKAGTPIVGGCVDTSAAFFNTPLVPGTLLHNSGSTDVLALLLKGPQPAADILMRPLGTGQTMPALWLAASTIAAAGAACEWAHQTFFREMDAGQFHKVLGQSVARASRERSAAVLRFLPTLAGDRTSMDQTRGAIEGITLSTTREDILGSLAAGLIAESVKRYGRLSQVQRVSATVFTTGGNKALGRAMRRAWPGRHKTRALEEANLTGLNRLACQIV